MEALNRDGGVTFMKLYEKLIVLHRKYEGAAAASSCVRPPPSAIKLLRCIFDTLYSDPEIQSLIAKQTSSAPSVASRRVLAQRECAVCYSPFTVAAARSSRSSRSSASASSNSKPTSCFFIASSCSSSCSSIASRKKQRQGESPDRLNAVHDGDGGDDGDGDGDDGGERSTEGEGESEEVESVTPIRIRSCCHETICETCLTTHVLTQIKDGTVLPYLACPCVDCHHPLALDDLLALPALPNAQILLALVIHMRALLVRSNQFLPCGKSSSSSAAAAAAGNDAAAHSKRRGAVSEAGESAAVRYGDWLTSECAFGFLKSSLRRSSSGSCAVVCAVCRLRQSVAVSGGDESKEQTHQHDPEIEAMIAAGTMKPCPCCQLLQFKEKGICNVMQCPGCQIWWNWRTLATGHNSTSLKDRARMEGTLWEPGELQYQLTLQRTNLPEFKALLERNGIEYNPNYVRGT